MNRRLVAAVALLAFASAFGASVVVPAWSGGVDRVPGVLSARSRQGEVAPGWAGARLARVLSPLLAVAPDHLPGPARPELSGRAGMAPEPVPGPTPAQRPPTPRSPPSA
jgi:hypothetical protein